ncbi:MAG: phosphoadenosine phosphosulfate reductase family protein, partial [Clostridia bacterium]|nr:phosphoadenosine phosphosulfate reductase family protein [Clostridia bacterium]
MNRELVNNAVDLLRRAEKLALRYDPENGYHLAFSGGKDSQVIYHLARMAGVKFRACMSLTSIDPAELIRFVRKNYPDVELIRPKASIYTIAKERKILPTRAKRWCCADFKEIHGAGKVTVVGVRRQESARRAGRQEIEVGGHKYSGSFGQWEEHDEMNVSCVNGKDKVILSPILEWSERDVWDFLNENGIPHCRLYDQGMRRIGCILCPMGSKRQKQMQVKRWPYVKEKWMEVIRYLIDNGYITKFTDPDLFFGWWISGESVEKFYADEVWQQ